MRSLEEMLGGLPIAQQVSIPSDPEPIPQHIYIDPGIVGYSDTHIQNSIYHLTIHGKLPLIGPVSVIDIGAGRGDIYRYIQQSYNYQPGELTYTGYETNPLLAQVGNEMLVNTNATIQNIDFLLSGDVHAEYVLMVGSLNLNYGRDTKDWPYFEQFLQKAIEVSTERVIFVMLHNNGGNESYIAYPIPNVTDLVLQYNLPFQVDYGTIEDVYILTIDTSKKRIA